MAVTINAQGDTSTYVPAHDFFERSIKDLMVNGLEYVERVRESAEALADNTVAAWNQTVFRPEPWVELWDKSADAWKGFVPGIQREWKELVDVSLDALTKSDNYFQTKSTSDIRASTDYDYGEIMSLLGNAAQVDALVTAGDKEFDTASIPVMSPSEMERMREPLPDSWTDDGDSEVEVPEPEPGIDDTPEEPRLSPREEEELEDVAPEQWEHTEPGFDPVTGTFTEGSQDGIQDRMNGLTEDSEEVELLENTESTDTDSDGNPITLPGYGDNEWSGDEGPGELDLDGTLETVRNYDVEVVRMGKSDESPDTFENVYGNKRSVAVEWMMNSGADFLSNMWDVSIMCTRVQGEESVRWDDLFTQMYENEVVFGNKRTHRFLGDAAAFMIRCEEVEVPQPKSEEYSVEFLWSTVKKVRSKVAFSRKSNLKILLDEPMYFMEIFNLLSNNNNVTDNITVRPLLNTPFTASPLWRDDLRSKKIQINIIVKHALLIRHGVYDELRGNDNPLARRQGGLDPDSLPYWVFEDVRFIGSTTDMEFKRDGPSTLVMEVPFTFRRVFKVDRQARGGTKTVPDLPLQSPRDPLDATDPTLSNSLNDQIWYWGPRNS